METVHASFALEQLHHVRRQLERCDLTSLLTYVDATVKYREQASRCISAALRSELNHIEQSASYRCAQIVLTLLTLPFLHI